MCKWPNGYSESERTCPGRIRPRTRAAVNPGLSNSVAIPTVAVQEHLCAQAPLSRPGESPGLPFGDLPPLTPALCTTAWLFERPYADDPLLGSSTIIAIKLPGGP